MRSAFYFGNPIEINGVRYLSPEDRKKEQEAAFYEFSSDLA